MKISDTMYVICGVEERLAESPAELDWRSKDSEQMVHSQTSRNKVENMIKLSLIYLSEYYIAISSEDNDDKTMINTGTEVQQKWKEHHLK